MPPKQLFLKDLKSKAEGVNAEGVNSSNTRANDSQRETLTRDLQTQKYECMVCFDKIRQRDRIWSCDTCWAAFHMKCINQWASVNFQNGKVIYLLYIQ